jgi:hypothetical protein
MRLLRIRGVPEDYSGEPLTSCLDLSRVGYLYPDMTFFPADNRSQNYGGDARKLCAGTQSGHISSCKRFAVFLKRSPDTATLEDIRRNDINGLEVSCCRYVARRAR